MINKLLGLVAGIALMGPIPAGATSYHYVGPAYTTFEGFPAPTTLGLFMSGTVTFTFDTSGYTGTIFGESNLISNVQLTSGSFTTAPAPLPSGSPNEYFTLTNGAITGWDLTLIVGNGVAVGNTLLSTGDNGGDWCDNGVCAFIISAIVPANPNPIPLANQEVYAARGPDNQPVPGAWIVATSAIPEISTWAMMLVGFASLGFMARRRKSIPASPANHLTIRRV
jgi:hypothetical protein